MKGCIILYLIANLVYSSNLNIPDNAKSTSLGEISYVDNQISIFTNPSLKGTIKTTKINLGILSYAENFNGSVGLGLNIGEEEGLSLGICIAKDNIFGISYGKKFNFGYLGTNLRLFEKKLEDSSFGVNFDLGFMTNISESKEFSLIPDKLLLSVNNILMNVYTISNEPNDLNVKAGIYFSSLKLGTDLKISKTSPLQINLGWEHTLDILRLRLGLRYNGNLFPSGGLALSIGEDEIAYSITTLNNYILMHQISLNIDISPTKKKEKTIDETTLIDIKENIKNYNNQAMEYFQSGRLKEAIEIWNKILKLDEINELAKKYIKEAQEILKQKIENYLNLSEEYFKNGQWNLAIEELEKVLNLDPSHKIASEKILKIKAQLIEAYNTGNTYYKDKEFLKAIEKWQWILERFPNYLDCEALITKVQKELKDSLKEKELISNYYNEAYKEYKNGNLTSAIEKINKILNIQPKNDDAVNLLNLMVDEHFKLGLKYYSQNLYEKAINEWKNVLNIDPSNEKARFYINDAQKQLQEKITKYFNKGIDNYNAGEYLKAIENWNIVLTTDPTHKEVNEYMVKALVSQGILCYRQDNLKEAIEYWEKAQKLKPNEEKITTYLKRAKNKLKALEELAK